MPRDDRGADLSRRRAELVPPRRKGFGRNRHRPVGFKPSFIRDVSTPITGTCKRTGSDLLRCGVTTFATFDYVVEEQPVIRAAHAVAATIQRKALISAPWPWNRHRY
jgi:hypothetical protein